MAERIVMIEFRTGDKVVFRGSCADKPKSFPRNKPTTDYVEYVRKQFKIPYSATPWAKVFQRTYSNLQDYELISEYQLNA